MKFKIGYEVPEGAMLNSAAFQILVGALGLAFITRNDWLVWVLVPIATVFALWRAWIVYKEIKTQ